MNNERQQAASRPWLDRIRTVPGGRLFVKLVVALLGVSMLIVGAFLVPLPGPGWLLILGGLAVLSIEFHWAQHVLHFVRSQLEAWTSVVKRQHPVVRAMVGVLGLVFVGVIVWASVRYSLGIDLVTKVRELTGV